MIPEWPAQICSPHGYNWNDSWGLNHTCPEPLNDLKYWEFLGPPREKMPELVAEGRVPMSVADVMKRRLEVLDSHCEKLVVEAWWEPPFPFDTGDGIFYHRDGGVKIVPNSRLIWKMQADSPVHHNALALGEDFESSAAVYESIEAIDLTHRPSLEEEVVNRRLSKEEAKENRILNLLVPDKYLLTKYIDTAFSRYGEDCNLSISVWTRRWMREEIGCELCVGAFWRLDFGLSGRPYVDAQMGRLVGITPSEKKRRYQEK